jgi:hypothetical protein
MAFPNNKKIWPIFTLKILNGVELAEIEDHAGYTVLDMKNMDKREFHGMSGSRRIETLKRGIVSWKNYTDENFKEVMFDGEGSLKRLPVEMQAELVNAIVEQLKLSEEELRSLE